MVDTLSALAVAPAQPVPAVNLFYPMDEFYSRAGIPAPNIVQVAGCDVPEPYRSLLVHDRDMTPTLTEAYGRAMQLRVLNRLLTDDVFAREIVLEVQGDGRRAVYAAIKIYLSLFSPEARRLIVECKTPFGTVLQQQGIAHFSRPLAFIEVAPNRAVNHGLGITGNSVLYGRRNALLNSAQVPLAQVLEIVPPEWWLAPASIESK